MHEVVVVVEVPRGGRVKRAADGSIDYVSPLACPFNYGSAPDLPSADGEPHDAFVLGPALALGHRGTWPVHGTDTPVSCSATWALCTSPQAK